MSIVETFECKSCGCTGRLHAPWRLCVTCGGEGFIERRVDDIGDKMLRGRMLAERTWKRKGKLKLRTSLPPELHSSFGIPAVWWLATEPLGKTPRRGKWCVDEFGNRHRVVRA